MKLLKYWLPPLVWAGVIFTFSSLKVYPSSTIDWQDFFVKKAAHVIEYSILYVLLYRAFINSTALTKKQTLFLTLILVIVYAITDEIHQSFTPGREPRARDIIIDGIAAAGTLIAIWKYLPKAPKILKRLAENLEVH